MALDPRRQQLQATFHVELDERVGALNRLLETLEQGGDDSHARGETFDAQALEELSPGSYAFAPKGSSMFGYAPEEAIVQVHGIGPFNIHWHSALKTLDDADAPSSFHLKKGQHVLAARGSGHIVQGYASGEILQYEIETLEGEHFMARENELQVQ